MKLFSAAALFLVVFEAVSLAQAKSPRLTAVTPDTGKPAASFSTAGENLTKAVVKDLYLTNGKDDIKMEIVAQTNEAIQFKVPANTKPGRYGLMILTADGKQFMEQPVKLTIE